MEKIIGLDDDIATKRSNRTRFKTLRDPLAYNEEAVFADNEIEKSRAISQDQLNSAKLFSSRDDYAETLNKNIAYLEVGVAWGHSAKMFIDKTNAKSADLLDEYNDAYGVFGVGGLAPENSSVTHEQYIKNKFSYHPNVNTIKGDARSIFFTLNKQYDFIFFDMDTERFLIRNLLLHSSKLVGVGGVIGLTSYVNYDSINYGMPVGILPSVNEFLHFNKNWSVDAMVLQHMGFHDIYIKRNS